MALAHRASAASSRMSAGALNGAHHQLGGWLSALSSSLAMAASALAGRIISSARRRHQRSAALAALA